MFFLKYTIELFKQMWNLEECSDIQSVPYFILTIVLSFLMQACKVEDLGKVDFEDEIKKRFKMVYVPNWFSVDLKTGVS